MDAQLCKPLSIEELAQWVMSLDERAREFYEERAGIIQFNGKLSRSEAEQMAYQQTFEWLNQNAI